MNSIILLIRYLLSFVVLLLPVLLFAEGADSFTLQECIELGIKNNLQVKKSGYNVSSAREKTSQISAQYEPEINLQVGKTDMETSGANPLYGTKVRKDSLTIGINKKFYYTGGRLNLDWTNEKTDSNLILQSSESGSFNPTYDSNITLSYSQPVLKNFAGRNDRVLIRISELGGSAAELSYTYQKNILVNRIENAYLSFSFAMKNLETQKVFLERSKRLLSINKTKLNDGLLEEVDVIATEAAVTLQEASILMAENSVKDAEDNLKRIIGMPEDEECSFIVEISTEFRHREVLEKEIITKALSGRFDLKIIENTVKISELSSQVRKNERLPSLDFIARYGLGNTGEGWSDNYNSITGIEYPTWYVGLNLNVFPLNRLSGSMLRLDEYIYKKNSIDLKDKKESIITECRSIARRINTLALYVNAAHKSLKLQKKKLGLEEVKFNHGRSSIQWLLRYQDDLSRAEVEFYRALTDYYKAKADLTMISREER